MFFLSGAGLANPSILEYTLLFTLAEGSVVWFRYFGPIVWTRKHVCPTVYEVDLQFNTCTGLLNQRDVPPFLWSAGWVEQCWTLKPNQNFFFFQKNEIRSFSLWQESSPSPRNLQFLSQGFIISCVLLRNVFWKSEMWKSNYAWANSWRFLFTLYHITFVL